MVARLPTACAECGVHLPACLPAACSLAMSAHSYYLQRLDKVGARGACPACSAARLLCLPMLKLSPPPRLIAALLCALCTLLLTPVAVHPCPSAPGVLGIGSLESCSDLDVYCHPPASNLSSAPPSPSCLLPAASSPQVRGLDPYVVHMTWTYNGISGKRSRLRDMGLWVDPPEYYGGGGGGNATSFVTVDITLPEVGGRAGGWLDGWVGG